MPAPTWPADLPPFLWGAATSAHQVEGGTDNDWTDWEAAGRVRGQARSGAACDHWHRYREDLDLLQAIGLNAYRFSVEWSRVEPEPGRVDPAALDHYREVARAARTRGLIPCVTLHHFTLPRWFARRGGFAAAGAGRPFLAQVARTVRALAPWVPCFVVFNEPLIYVLMGYVRGEWPPGLRQPHRLLTLSRRLARLQQEAYAVIKAEAPGALVGVAKHQVHFLPATPRWRDRAAAALAGRLFNDAFLEAVADRLDFIGLNYYTRNWVTARHPLTPGFHPPGGPGGPVTDMDWEVDPEGLEVLLHRLARFRLPIVVTENGIATTDDGFRTAFLEAHLAALARAGAAGVPIRGYFYWAALDNFEWALGFGPRFGLIAVDYATQARRVRPSAAVLGAWARAGPPSAPPPPSPTGDRL